jgi:hypothetical protein|tara:strand:- start:293 stop:517 length:225 start_codon:yes stop_codon:yes gene_type:complete
MINYYDVACDALHNLERHGVSGGQITLDYLMNRYTPRNNEETQKILHITRLAHDATFTEDFRSKAEFILLQLND